MAIRQGLAMERGCCRYGVRGCFRSGGEVARSSAVPAADAPICVYQHSPPQGDAYFALGVRADRAMLPLGDVRTHAILVDTSASQFGPYRQRLWKLLVITSLRARQWGSRAALRRGRPGRAVDDGIRRAEVGCVPERTSTLSNRVPLVRRISWPASAAC